MSRKASYTKHADQIAMTPWLIDTHHDLTDCEVIERFIMEHCEQYTDEYRDYTELMHERQIARARAMNNRP